MAPRATRDAVPRAPGAAPGPTPAWAVPVADLLRDLGARPDGLTAREAAHRQQQLGPNELEAQRAVSPARVLWNQLRSPLLLLLLFAVAASVASAEWADATIVLTIVGASVGIGYRRELGAERAVAGLRARVRTMVRVVREGVPSAVPLAEIVPGDVLVLAAGSLVPADARVLEATDCHVSEAMLTGESFPVEKEPGVVDAHTPLGQRTNCVFRGSNVRSGTATCVVFATGPRTALGSIAHRLTLRPPITEFEHGIRRFGYLLTSAMLVMVLLVFAAHTLRGRPPGETLLFAIALAVGLSPELLPGILSLNLSRGAEMMARHGVLVRRLSAIEDLGSMDVLCTDKTGTLTEGVIVLEGAYDPAGATSARVLEAGGINAALETGLPSPLDDAIGAAHAPALATVRKLAEIPFDFVRKRVSVIVQDAAGVRLITKGAFAQVLEACTALPGGAPLDDAARAALEARFAAWGTDGVRVLAVAERRLDTGPAYHRDDEHDLTFLGFLTFLDRPKPGVAEAIAGLARRGVAIKVITGDARLVAQHVAALVGLPHAHVVTGRELDDLNDEALWYVADRTELFVEVDPNQKERIIRALRKMGHVVGFLGDGVNDAPAMHAADTSLSVEAAVDVAREAADFVLLERDLDVIRQGVDEGRRTFANTLKYVLTTTSANLGNMISMAVVSLVIPFLPLLASQILLNNFLSDIPAIGIAGDDVDPELVERPRRWDIGFIGRFMIEFGLLSSAFDALTFVVLLGPFAAAAPEFRTAWFVESLLTELLIALVVRTRRPVLRSRPGRVLLIATVVLVPVALALPYAPGIGVIGFVPLPPGLLGAIVGITLLYVIAAEQLKRWFYRPRDAA